MKTRILLIIMLLCDIAANAVLKEKDLEQTLSVLRSELEYYRHEQAQKIKKRNYISEMQHIQLIKTMQQSEQIALMLYSQKQDYTFDLAYACREATQLYNQFAGRKIPFDKILSNYQIEIERYNNIIEVLESLPPRVKDQATQHDTLPAITRLRIDSLGTIDSLTSKLSDALPKHLEPGRKSPFALSSKAIEDRDTCLKLAISIRANIVELHNKTSQDSENYQRVAQRLEKVNDYALERYSDIKNLIFKNGGTSYFKILSHFSFYTKNISKEIKEKYSTPQHGIESEWRGPIVIGIAFFIIVYLSISIILSNIFIRFFLPQRFKTERFIKKKFHIILAVSILTFAIVLFVLKMFSDHNFMIMASTLLIEYASLVAAVLFSLIIRCKHNQIRSSFNIYIPILILGFIIIFFRIIFISNNLVQLIFPPITIVFAIWQGMQVKRLNKNIPFYDVAYTYISLAVMVLACIASWIGYTLFSVQIVIWWLFQLTAIQSITLLKHIVKKYEFKYIAHKLIKRAQSRGEAISTKQAGAKAFTIINSNKKTIGDYIETTWLYDLFKMTLIPLFSVVSIIACIYFAADIFDLTESCKFIFTKDFIDVEGVCQLSLKKILVVMCIFFIFKFVNHAVKAIYKKYKMKNDASFAEANITLANNLISIAIWGFYFIFILVLLRVPKSGISIVTAGLATGIGFAMKDILENFFYGMSLMTGRLHVGDYIECDGIRGKVDSITYQSTQIHTLDGCVIAFLNSALFNKSFKNLTKNYSYEFIKLPISVAYGTDVQHVRDILTKALSALKKYEKNGIVSIDRKKGVNIVFNDFGESSIDLWVTIWVTPEDKFRITGIAKELIYNTLNSNGIEIPFPQRTLHIKKESAE